MSTDPAERYRRRTRWPAIAIVGALAVVTGIVWAVALKPAPPVDRSCNQPGPAPVATASGAGSADAVTTATDTTSAATPSATDTPAASPSAVLAVATLGAVTDRNTLRDTRPAAPSTIQLRVVNASSTAGMARTVTEAWRRSGFDSIKDAVDDPLYPAKDLRCFAEIRYGAAGSQAARTVLIVAPCATLMLDDRFDDSVDFAVGGAYTDAPPTDDQVAQLAQIQRDSTPPAVLEGATQAAPTAAPIPPLPTATNCPS